jgi:RNA polymerase sigma-70 factor (ECF subfamily)
MSVIEFMVSTGKPRLRHVLTRASGQPAVAWYMRRAGVYRPSSIEVLALEGDRVREITAFASTDLFPRFGLPADLG